MPIKIETEGDLQRFLAILNGENPDAQQQITDFMDMGNVILQTNLPTRKDVQRIAYLDYADRSFFPDKEINPFGDAVKSISTSFSAKGGMKSNQYVDIVRQNPVIADLQGMKDDKKQGVIDRFLGRGKTE